MVLLGRFVDFDERFAERSHSFGNRGFVPGLFFAKSARVWCSGSDFISEGEVLLEDLVYNGLFGIFWRGADLLAHTVCCHAIAAGFFADVGQRFEG